MADIFQEVEEDLRRDRYQRLAKKYGGYLVAGMLLLVLGTTGYVLWKNWHETRERAATLQLAEAVDQVAQAGATAGQAAPAPAVEALDRVVAESRSGPASLARFYEAGLRVRSGDRPAAVAIYDGLAKDTSVAALYRDLATLLAVQLQVDDGDAKSLTERLAPLTVDTSPWRFTALELSGLLAARTGDTERARTTFQQLADDNGAPAGLRARAAELAAFYGKS
jgi:hypothetical protein